MLTPQTEVLLNQIMELQEMETNLRKTFNKELKAIQETMSEHVEELAILLITS